MHAIRLFLAISLLATCSLGTAAAQETQNAPEQYRIKATAPDGRVLSYSNVVEVYKPLSITLASAFTPNGDGLNDTFGAIGDGIEAMELNVYSRTGQLVFRAKDISARWDGHHNGSPLPNGVYRYELIAYGKELGEVQKTGQVTLLR